MLAVSAKGSISRLFLAALIAITLTATSSSTAIFTAPGPGLPLSPTGDAASLIELTQGQRSLVWVSKIGDVETVAVQGWPSSHGTDELGGAKLIQTVYRNAGAVDFGEIPMTVEFTFSG